MVKIRKIASLENGLADVIKILSEDEIEATIGKGISFIRKCSDPDQPQQIDLNFMEWLGENLIPFSIVFTKADKLKSLAIERNISEYKDKMLLSNWEEIPPIFVTSSFKNTGGKEILTYIDQLNRTYSENSFI